jgi:hypothetical protein
MALHFERCENLESSWNDRVSNPPEGCTLLAVDTGDGWELEVGYPENDERGGEAVALLAWPAS